MSATEVLLAVVIAVGLVGILVPMLPGSVLVLAAILLWAADTGGTTAWVVLAICATFLVTGAVVKYLVPGRRLQQRGVPTSTLFLGGVLGVVGFFVVPVVGLPLGFVLGIYLAEWRRTTRAQAWPATLAALRAVGLSILIELTFATLATATWAVAAVTVG